MFRSDDAARLRRQVDQFNIPMFIAELRPTDGEFELLALNASHEAQTGLKMDEVIKRPFSTILPSDEAEHVNKRYARCIHQDAPLRYRERLHLPRGPMIWDTSLTRLALADGRERIVGSAVVVERVRRDDRDTLAFEDVSYFATTSSMRLEQIASILAAVEQQIIAPERLVGSVGMLAGLCRSIDETMKELRSIAQERLDSENRGVPLISLGSETDPHEAEEIEAVIDALILLANDLSSGVELSAAPDRDQGKPKSPPGKPY